MEKLILTIKDSSKMPFLLQLIKQLDFIEVEKVKNKKASEEHDFFGSAGLWANRDINIKEHRMQAWDRTK